MALHVKHRQFVNDMGRHQGTRDGELVVSSTVSGDMSVIGPRRINARAFNEMAIRHGVAWSTRVDPDSTAARPTLKVRQGDDWRAPRQIPTTVTGSLTDTVVQWATTRKNLQVSYTEQTGRIAGSVRVLSFEARGVITSDDITDVLQVPGIVNVWITSTGMAVWIAKESATIGSLQHLSAIGRLSARLGPRQRQRATRRFRRRPGAGKRTSRNYASRAASSSR